MYYVLLYYEDVYMFCRTRNVFTKYLLWKSFTFYQFLLL